MNVLRQGIRKLSSDRQTESTEIISHATSPVINEEISNRTWLSRSVGSYRAYTVWLLSASACCLSCIFVDSNCETPFMDTFIMPQKPMTVCLFNPHAITASTRSRGRYSLSQEKYAIFSIGVARIFSGGGALFPQKVYQSYFLVAALNTQGLKLLK